tara:strand:- start:689 stop:1279 length:591 start_codon:yes stop_codon:yes gene_type:complete
MVRQYEHTRACAKEDAEKSTRPRKVTAWFGDGRGVCALCRRGLGKNYTRDQRKAHEQDFMHTDAHNAYLTAFEEAGTARYERLVTEAKERTERARLDLETTLLAPANVPNLRQWLAILPNECTELKAGLFEHACRAGPDPGRNTHTPRLGILGENHIRLAQHLLLLKSVQTVLGNDGEADTRATTVASLCRLYLEV